MMKNAILMLIAVFFAGCGQNPRTGNGFVPIDPGVYRDTETGCEYLARGNDQGGLTPRMGADGKQICREKP